MAWPALDIESPLEWKKVAIKRILSFFTFIISMPLLLFWLVKRDYWLAYLTTTEGAIFYSTIFLSTLFIVSIYLFYIEINNKCYLSWKYWQADAVDDWLIPKHTPLYLLSSAVISNNDHLVDNINGLSQIQEDDEKNPLIPSSENVISGNDRFVFIFEQLLNELTQYSMKVKNGFDIYINSASEIPSFVQSSIKKQLKRSLFSHYENLLFIESPDYNQQLDSIKTKQKIALIFTINYYSSKSQEENEIGSGLLLSPFHDNKALKIFPPMPFSMENHQNDIDQMCQVQQQPNQSLTLICASEFENSDLDKVLIYIESKGISLVTEQCHAGRISIEQYIGKHPNFSPYHMLATLNASQFKTQSLWLFYSMSNALFCHAIGTSNSYKDSDIENIPKLVFPSGCLLFSLFLTLLYIIYSFIDPTQKIDSFMFSLISTSILLSSFIIPLILFQLYINLFWWPTFLIKLNIK